MTRCSDNTCGDCSWCGYQDDDEEIEEVEQDGPEPDDEWDDDPHGEWVDYLNK